MKGNYILEGKQPKRIEDIGEWGRWMSLNERAVEVTRISKGVMVSTVFLGIDHNYMGDGEPILFETMVFGGEYDQFQNRYSTWDDAVKGHKAACKIVAGNPVLKFFRRLFNRIKKLWTK